MAGGHTGVAAHAMGLKNSVLGRNTIDVHGAVTTLRCNVFIEWVPGDALNEVGVFCNFANTFSCATEALSVAQ